MKQYYSLSALLVLIASLAIQGQVNAQPKPKRSHFQITTNPLDWANRKANICTQWLLLPKTTLCAGGSLHLWSGQEGNYNIQSITNSFETELRLFPLGGSRQAIKRDKRPAFFKKSRKGCPTFSSLQGWWPHHTPPLSGLYIAPGFSLEKQRFTYAPNFGNYSTEFKYIISRKSGVLTAGYCLHLGPITVGVRAGLSAGKYKWSGPNDIFGDSLNNVKWPVKISLQKHLGFEVGVNF